jgi:hypothetical protein
MNEAISSLTRIETLKSDFSELPIEIPHDRYSNFEPQIITID